MLLDRREQSSVLRLTVSARKSRADVEEAVVAAVSTVALTAPIIVFILVSHVRQVLVKHRELCGDAVPTPPPSVVSDLAGRYAHRTLPLSVSPEGAGDSPRGAGVGGGGKDQKPDRVEGWEGSRAQESRPQSEVVRAATLLRTMTTMVRSVLCLLLFALRT